MAGIVGGSQLDVQSLVSQLVAAERTTQDRQIAREANRVTTQISAVGTLMGAMSNFRAALSSLKTEDVFSTRSASSSDTAQFTAAAGANAVPGNYQVVVQQLAKAQQISSNPFAEGASSTVGTGTLTLSLGEDSFSITVDESNGTLAGIRDAINRATDNPGIRATLVQGTEGSRLVLSSAKTGVENTIAISQSGGDGGLAALTYSAEQPDNYAEITAAQDAIVRIANAETRSATNTIESAIDGVTLTLLKATPADEDAPTLSVNYDSAAVKKRIETFVSAYNGLMSQMSRLRSYDAATETAGPMLGDSLLSGIESQLRRGVSGVVSGQQAGFDTLAAIGIVTKVDGTLEIDSTKLQKALDGNFGAVGKLFGSENGVAARLFNIADEQLKTGNGLQSRSENLVAQQRVIEKRKEALDVRMQAVQQNYLRQFTALDTLLSQLQVTSSYMAQQIDSLANMRVQK